MRRRRHARAAAQLPVPDRPRGRARGRHRFEIGFRYGGGSSAERAAARADDPAPARRLPGRAGGGRRRRVPRRREGDAVAEAARVRHRGRGAAAGAAVVGADGVNGITAVRSALGGKPAIGVALEGNVRYAADPRRDAIAGALCWSSASCPGGYGWVFPKGDHVNVGVGGWEREGPRLRDSCAAFARRTGSREDDLEGLRGYRLPLRRREAPARPRARPARRRCGGARRPGLRRRHVRGVPLRAARLARRCSTCSPAARRASSRTAERLTAHARRTSGRSWGVKPALDRFPRAAFGLAKRRFVWPVVEGLLRGEIRATSVGARGHRPRRR